jgi:FkbM family methyltransferase
MTRQGGLWFPADVGTKWKHTLRHVGSLEWALANCTKHRTAVQAGGNIGAWPKRMAEVFDRVYTFEPEPISLACLEKNVPANVIVSGAALGESDGFCAIDRQSLGSHRVIDGHDIPMTRIDALHLTDVDLIQLDVEGYEWHALAGAIDTIRRCTPLIQVELRNFTEAYGLNDAAVRDLLQSLGYQCVSEQPGNDFVFAWMPI